MKKQNRREFLGSTAYPAFLWTVAMSLGACSPALRADNTTEAGEADVRSYPLPTDSGSWVPHPLREGRVPVETGTVDIQGVGRFSFDPGDVRTVRPDIFQPGHFSVFDVLVHVAERGDIDMTYHFDDGIDTHVIESINGRAWWWYVAYYSAGWWESIVFRMDMFPYKDGTTFQVFNEGEERLVAIHRTFKEEVERKERNNGQVIIPELEVQSPRFSGVFENVVATPHDIRRDVLKPGTVTALDAILSLGEGGEFSEAMLTWYGHIGYADPVDHYFLEQVDESKAYGGCGFVYETGPREFSGFSGSHIHLPSDLRVTVSPEYALWFWICI